MGIYTVRARPRFPCLPCVTRRSLEVDLYWKEGGYCVSRSLTMAVRVHDDEEDDPQMTRRLPIVQRNPHMMPWGTSRKPASQPSVRVVQAEADWGKFLQRTSLPKAANTTELADDILSPGIKYLGPEVGFPPREHSRGANQAVRARWMARLFCPSPVDLFGQASETHETDHSSDGSALETRVEYLVKPLVELLDLEGRSLSLMKGSAGCPWCLMLSSSPAVWS